MECVTPPIRSTIRRGDFDDESSEITPVMSSGAYMPHDVIEEGNTVTITPINTYTATPKYVSPNRGRTTVTRMTPERRSYESSITVPPIRATPSREMIREGRVSPRRDRSPSPRREYTVIPATGQVSPSRMTVPPSQISPVRERPLRMGGGFSPSPKRTARTYGACEPEYIRESEVSTPPKISTFASVRSVSPSRVPNRMSPRRESPRRESVYYTRSSDREMDRNRSYEYDYDEDSGSIIL